MDVGIGPRDGFDFTGAEFSERAREAGLAESQVISLAESASAAIVYKPE